MDGWNEYVTFLTPQWQWATLYWNVSDAEKRVDTGCRALTSLRRVNNKTYLWKYYAIKLQITLFLTSKLALWLNSYCSVIALAPFLPLHAMGAWSLGWENYVFWLPWVQFLSYTFQECIESPDTKTIRPSDEKRMTTRSLALRGMCVFSCDVCQWEESVKHNGLQQCGWPHPFLPNSPPWPIKTDWL